MLLAGIERSPDRTYLYDHLARVYEASGDSERAIATWWRGLDIARGRGSRHPDDRLVYIDLIFHLLGRGDIGDEFGALVSEALEAFPRMPSLELAAARYEFVTGRPVEALARTTWLVSLRQDDLIGTGSSYDGRVFGEWGWDLRGLCEFALGDHAAAAESFRRAEAANPDIEVYGVRRRLAEASAADPAR
jgi:tetratricopeptide (TPR) repeat protein